MSGLPLEGVRVIDFTAIIGAPYGTMMLADMGAEVIRMESRNHFPSHTRGYYARPDPATIPRMGPQGRGYPGYDPGARPWNRFALFNCVGHNKLSCTMDASRPEGHENAKAFISLCDVVVENMPGALDRMGLGYQDLRRIRPDIIVVSVSGMGSTGPYKDLRGFGRHFEAVLGHSWLRGYPEDHPDSITTAVTSDPAAGAAVVWSTIAALEYRNRTGEGQHVDISMAELFIHHLGSAFVDYAWNGRLQRTSGNRHPSMAPHGCYPCKGDDRWVVLAVRTDEAWRALRQAMGNPAWARPPRFADAYRRLRDQDELDRRIAEWTRRHDNRELQDMLQAHGVAAGRVVDAADLFQDPHLRARGFYETISHPEAGTHDYPFTLWGMSETPFELRQTSPLLGEHNRYVYRELLGIGEAEYQRLEELGQIGPDFAPHVP